jgi:transposase
MEMWTEIRRKVLVEGTSKRSIRRDYRISAEVLEKILAHPEPPGYRQSVPRPKPKLGQFLPVIDEILEADKTAPLKQRHTAKRIYERLRDEYGYTGCSLQVRRAVSRSRHYSKEVFVPLSHPPGHAQFDFGEATVAIAGIETKVALAVMTLPYSDAYFVSAYPRECTETFQAGHIAAFEFFGGVPVRTSYDNTSIAVKKVVARIPHRRRRSWRSWRYERGPRSAAALACKRAELGRCQLGPRERRLPRGHLRGLISAAAGCAP